MYTYIRKTVPNHYVELEEPLSEELYNNLGNTWLDYLDDLWVLLTDELLAFKDAYPTASLKEIFNMEMIAPKERTLKDAKKEKLLEINNYDNSSSVNGFTINNSLESWFTVQERTNYSNSINAAKLLGVETLTFYIENNLLQISPLMAEQMLASIQLYADACYIVTKLHKLNVESLDSIEAVDSYDYTINYPSKLNFDL